jgi:hypothetical protein
VFNGHAGNPQGLALYSALGENKVGGTSSRCSVRLAGAGAKDTESFVTEVQVVNSGISCGPSNECDTGMEPLASEVESPKRAKILE